VPPVTSMTSSPAAAVPYFATEAHYLSLAGRLAAALQDGGLVLVTGDPSANPQLLSEALRKVARARRMVIDISCSSELEIEQLSRACCAGPAEPAPALFVFDEVDRLSDQQVAQTCKAFAQRAGESAAAVLLSRGCFSDRLEAPLLQPVKEALAARFRLDEIGEDESIDFLRHQLQTRYRDDEKRGVPSVIFPALAVLGVVATLGVCALLVVRHIDTPHPTTATVAATSPPPAAQPPAAAPAMPATTEPAPTTDAAPAMPATTEPAPPLLAHPSLLRSHRSLRPKPQCWYPAATISSRRATSRRRACITSGLPMRATARRRCGWARHSIPAFSPAPACGALSGTRRGRRRGIHVPAISAKPPPRSA